MHTGGVRAGLAALGAPVHLRRATGLGRDGRAPGGRQPLAPHPHRTQPQPRRADGGPHTLRLYRETHLRPVTTGVVRDALTAMFDQAPFDDDYVTPWDPATRVLDVKIAGDVATVHLSAAAATTRGGSEAAELAVAQLVWTATAAALDVRAVRILIEGEAPADFWGALALVEPVERAPAENVLAPVWLDLAPRGDGDPVTVSRGDTFRWRGHRVRGDRELGVDPRRHSRRGGFQHRRPGRTRARCLVGHRRRPTGQLRAAGLFELGRERSSDVVDDKDVRVTG